MAENLSITIAIWAWWAGRSCSLWFLDEMSLLLSESNLLSFIIWFAIWWVWATLVGSKWLSTSAISALWSTSHHSNSSWSDSSLLIKSILNISTISFSNISCFCGLKSLLSSNCSGSCSNILFKWFSWLIWSSLFSLDKSLFCQSIIFSIFGSLIKTSICLNSSSNSDCILLIFSSLHIFVLSSSNIGVWFSFKCSLCSSGFKNSLQWFLLFFIWVFWILRCWCIFFLFLSTFSWCSWCWISLSKSFIICIFWQVKFSIIMVKSSVSLNSSVDPHVILNIFSGISKFSLSSSNFIIWFGFICSLFSSNSKNFLQWFSFWIIWILWVLFLYLFLFRSLNNCFSILWNFFWFFSWSSLGITFFGGWCFGSISSWGLSSSWSFCWCCSWSFSWCSSWCLWCFSNWSSFCWCFSNWISLSIWLRSLSPVWVVWSCNPLSMSNFSLNLILSCSCDTSFKSSRSQCVGSISLCNISCLIGFKFLLSSNSSCGISYRFFKRGSWSSWIWCSWFSFTLSKRLVFFMMFMVVMMFMVFGSNLFKSGHSQ